MSSLFDDKLLKCLRTEQAPLEEADPTKQKLLLETWKTLLEPHWKCSLEVCYTYNTRSLALKLMLSAEEGYSTRMHGRSRYGGYSGDDQLTVLFKNGKLGVQHSYYEPIPLASPDALIQLKPKALERYLTWKREWLKRKKLLEFKTSAIQNTVRVLAQELQFDYQLSTLQTKLVLLVRLDERNGLNIDIPLKSFQSVLSNLKAAITAIRSLYEQGLRFKMVMVSDDQHWTPYVRTGADSKGLKLSTELPNEAEDPAEDDDY